MLILSGCISKPSVPCLKPLPVPAWMMQPPPDLQTPLSEII
ncbi:lysis system o-spanin lipoprotein Rz1, partial [Xenorhabdus koppenhoeferi]